jgi:hypothetical protein
VTEMSLHVLAYNLKPSQIPVGEFSHDQDPELTLSPAERGGFLHQTHATFSQADGAEIVPGRCSREARSPWAVIAL